MNELESLEPEPELFICYLESKHNPLNKDLLTSALNWTSSHRKQKQSITWFVFPFCYLAPALEQNVAVAEFWAETLIILQFPLRTLSVAPISTLNPPSELQKHSEYSLFILSMSQTVFIVDITPTLLQTKVLLSNNNWVQAIKQCDVMGLRSMNDIFNSF